MSQNAPQPMDAQSGFASTTSCPNCHSTMPFGLRFCRNCGFRLGEGVAEYTETVRFSGNTTPAGFGMTAGQVVPSVSNACARRKKRMSGMTWIFLAMILFFLCAGVITQFIPRARHVGIVGIGAPPAPPAPPRAVVGVHELDTTERGVTFDSIEAPGSPADKAGLVGGDIITSFDGPPVKEDDELTDLLGQIPVGKTVDVVYIRDGETKTTKLTTISKADLDQLGRAFAIRTEGKGRLGVDVGRDVEMPNVHLRGVR